MAVETSDFVNGCRNVVWLAGYARRADDGTVLLAQSDNNAKSIPIQMGPTLRCPPPNEAFEVKCHLHSERTEDGDERTWLEAYFIRRASVRAVPNVHILLNGLRKRSAVAERPFASVEDVLAELEEYQSLSREAVKSLLPSQRKQARDQFTNYVGLSGFLGHRRFIPPAEGSWDDFGSLLFELRQSEDAKQALRIHIPNAGTKFGKQLGRPFWPLAVSARLRVEPVVNEAGEVVDRKLLLETSPNQIGGATYSQFAGKQFPAWWKAQLNELNANGSKVDTASDASPRTPESTPQAGPEPEASALKPGAKLNFDGPGETW